VFVTLKNLPVSTTYEHLTDLVLPVIEGRFFQSKGRIDSLKIFEHAVVKVSPDSAKMRLIGALNGRALGHQKLMVAEYVLRQWQNDRRHNNETASTVAHNRRKSERRRHRLKKVIVAE
jgi:hypothetical protein